MFVFPSHTLPRSRRDFPVSLTTPALNQRRIRWFGTPDCPAIPEGLPPSLAQHGSCQRSSTSLPLSFQDTRRNPYEHGLKSASKIGSAPASAQPGQPGPRCEVSPACRASLAAGLGIQAFPHRQRPERAVLEGGPQVIQEPGHAHLLPDPGGGDAVHAGGVRALVTRNPVKRDDQRRRVMHEIEQVIKPAARISRRPSVKLGLNPRYPRPRPFSRTGCQRTRQDPCRRT